MPHFPDFHTTPFETDAARREAAALPKGQRQMLIKHILFPYEQFVENSEKLARFHFPVKETGIADTGSLGVMSGNSRSGKTQILKAYIKNYPPVRNCDGFTFPVVYVQCRLAMGGAEIARQIHIATGRTPPSKPSPGDFNHGTLSRLLDYGVKLILLDDAHFIFQTRRDRRDVFLEFLKDILDEDCCNVLAVGLVGIADAFRQSMQLSGRGGLPAINVDDCDDSTKVGRSDFRMFLDGIDERLPFRRSSLLAHQDYVDDFFAATDGSRGRAMNIVRSAAYRALNDDAPMVTHAHLRAATADRAVVDADEIGFDGQPIERRTDDDSFA